MVPTSRKVRRGWADTGASVPSNLVPGNLPAALAELGIVVDRVDGVEHYALCPAHAERTGKVDRHASWSVNEVTGAHYCFSCGFKGGFAYLVSYLQGGDLSAGAEWVRARGGIERARAALQRASAAPASSGAPDTTKVLNEASLALYGPPPAEALASRSISAAAARHYGVLWDSSRQMWILPVRDPDRYSLLGWQEKSARVFRNRPYGLKKSTTLFGIDAFTDGQTAILVESPLDCPRILSAGVPGALSSFGVGVSEIQMHLIYDRTDDLVIALDDDAAGWKRSEELRQAWGGRMRVRFWNYGGTGKDPGEQTDAQIQASFAQSFSSILARF